MTKQATQWTFTFVNPNTSKEVERQLQKILADKLRFQYRGNKSPTGIRKGAADE